MYDEYVDFDHNNFKSHHKDNFWLVDSDSVWQLLSPWKWNDFSPFGIFVWQFHGIQNEGNINNNFNQVQFDVKDIIWCCFNTFNVFLDGHFSYGLNSKMLSSLCGKGFIEVHNNNPVRAKTSADLPVIQRSNKNFWHIDWDSMGWSCFQSFSVYASKSCELILSLTFITPYLCS